MNRSNPFPQYHGSDVGLETFSFDDSSLKASDDKRDNKYRDNKY